MATSTPSTHPAPTTSVAHSVQDLGKLRRLQRITDAEGFIRVAAIDHPENYLALFDSDLTRVTDEEVVVSKLELVAAMSAESTAVLLDPVWSFGQAVLSQAAVSPMASTKQLKQKKALRSKARRRPMRQSRSKTISVSIRKSPA